MYQDNRHLSYASQQGSFRHTIPQQQAPPPQPQTKIVFVGNLSYFCEDRHLHDLFNEYGEVNNARVMRSDDNTRSLMFGFVTMSSVNQAKEMERIFNGHMFMGRKLRVALSDKRENTRPWNDQNSPGIQVHVSFCSFFEAQNEEQRKDMPRPTESFIRRALVDQGNFMDVTIKEYQIHENLQEGYGFITLPSIDEAVELTNSFKQVVSLGITLNCTLTHKHNPTNHKKHNNKVPRTISPPSGGNTTASSDKEESSVSGKSDNVPVYPIAPSYSHAPVPVPVPVPITSFPIPEIIPYPYASLVAPSPPPSALTIGDVTAMYSRPNIPHQAMGYAGGFGAGPQIQQQGYDQLRHQDSNKRYLRNNHHNQRGQNYQQF